VAQHGAPLLTVGAAAFAAIALVTIMLIAFAAAGSAESDACGADGGSQNASDPIDMPALEIAIRIYEVGGEMEMGEREVLTAFTVALVESGGGVTMRNVQGGDADSTGVFQQRDLPEWTQGPNGEPRNRDNVSDAARTFFEHLRPYDHGQSIGELAADIQRPREDLRYKYAAALPRARYFLTRVEAELQSGGGDSATLAGLAPAMGCEGGTSSSAPASMGEAETVYQPRELATIPAKYANEGTKIDARLLGNAIFLAERYDVTISQGFGHRGTGSPSVSHNYGTALDMVPARSQALAEWRRTAERLARDVGWTPSCGSSGSRPACDLVPAIEWVGYNGYSEHGDPAHTGNPHIHINFACSCGTYDGVFHGLSDWVKRFPVESSNGSGTEV
jgi:hypothetical protein